jgi:DNA repair protein RecO (recombination protein O)
MQWTDKALLLNTRRFGETALIVQLFSREHGIHNGVLQGGTSRKKAGMVQKGNLLQASWRARLKEQLGTVECELLVPAAAIAMQEAPLLQALTGLCHMIGRILPEQDPHPQLFDVIEAFLEGLQEGREWAAAYACVELFLLKEAGFGLDLRECAATGVPDNLIYVSPKSSRAVSAEAGEPWKNRLLPLPAFLREWDRESSLQNAADALRQFSQKPAREQIGEALFLTGYFLQEMFHEIRGEPLPASREQLMTSFAGKSLPA